MIPQTLGAASLMGTLVLGSLMARWAVRPAPVRCRHRREYGAATPQQFIYCPTCARTTAATVHGQLLRCTENHLVGGDA